MTRRNECSWGYLLLVLLLLTACEQRETALPERKNIEDAVFASGHIEQEYEYTVAAKVEGILVDLPFSEGDPVGRNAVIARIESEVQQNQLRDAVVVHQDAASNATEDSPRLRQIAAQLEQAEQQLALDEENYQRFKALREKNSVSQLDFEQAELRYQTTQQQLVALRESYAEAQRALQLNEARSLVQVNTQRSLLGDYQLTAPAPGTMIHLFKQPGELVRRGETIALIGSGPYRIKLLVAEDDITKVDVGQSVAIHINTYPHQTFPATVTKIYPGFDETEQSYVVEARFMELPEKMFSGTQLQANIETGIRENVLVIPSAYVARGSYVLLANGEEVPIVIGTKNSDWTEVISGISDTNRIAKPAN